MLPDIVVTGYPHSGTSITTAFIAAMGFHEATVAINDFSNVTVHNQAIWDKRGVQRFYHVTDGHSNRSSLARPPTNYESVEKQVPTMTLDDHNCGRSPDIVKIDANGAETLVLRGMTRLRPTVICKFDQKIKGPNSLGVLAADAFDALPRYLWYEAKKGELRSHAKTWGGTHGNLIGVPEEKA